MLKGLKFVGTLVKLSSPVFFGHLTHSVCHVTHDGEFELFIYHLIGAWRFLKE
ncbi:hypothetical protein FC96_GL002385 [Secundilactobacillus kimchicus JCM 15530]|uniref:Uncharacterized protein n=1 Tax=Secundilactobacillus kimchicus JCM 15530 TaxID=1302272 RepID=A0A0R1HLP9_9LACO|nr:hypothetical protein FC96_GL002385 [Secundilactobacillus kimchicus JCM 15530]